MTRRTIWKVDDNDNRASDNADDDDFQNTL